MAFKAILDEVDQLHDVCERLEGLAEQHRPVSEVLVNIAGNIRNIATVLAVRVDLATEKSRDSVLVANHHIAPGKKQWTWGNHPFC
jgi:hypothetical protein